MLTEAKHLARHTLPCALFILTLGASSIAHADIITPEDQVVSLFGVERITYRDDPSWHCQRAAADEADKLDGVSEEARKAKREALNQACITEKADEIADYERRLEENQQKRSTVLTALPIAALLILLAIIGGVFVVLRKKRAGSQP